MTVDQLLDEARGGLRRLDAAAAQRAVDAGAWLIDIRTDHQIARDGVIPGARLISRNTLEWRLDPSCEYCHPDGPGLDDVVIVVCDEGYQSSLAAATLQRLGFRLATDLEGGFQAWRVCGLPVVRAGRVSPTAGRTHPRPEGA